MLLMELYTSINTIIDCLITNKNHSEFIRELGGKIKFDEEYESIYYRQFIILRKDTPSEILRQYFQQCITKTLEKLHEENKEPSMIIINIFSGISLVNIEFSRDYINDNIINELMNLFESPSINRENRDEIEEPKEPILKSE